MDSGDQIKIVMVGAGGVGKSCITIQYVRSLFVKDYDPTIEESYRKQVQVGESVCMLEIVDTAGQEEFSGLREQWIRYGEGFFLVYSITARSTFTRELETIMNDIERVRESLNVNKKAPRILFGNKIDLEGQRQISTQEGQALAEKHGIDFFEGSAASNLNVKEAYERLVLLIQASRSGGKLKPSSDAPPGTLMAARKSSTSKRKQQCIIL